MGSRATAIRRGAENRIVGDGRQTGRWFAGRLDALVVLTGVPLGFRRRRDESGGQVIPRRLSLRGRRPGTAQDSVVAAFLEVGGISVR